MQKSIVWDLPIRVFHWLFALCCLGAFGLAVVGEHDPDLFALHMLLGISAGFMVVVRLVLGVVGNRHNRFAAMLFSPKETAGYLRDAVVGNAKRYLVHNPGSAMAGLAMLVAVALLVWTGAFPPNDLFEELHGAIGFGLFGLIALHLAGIANHTLRHKENISLAMVTGNKQGSPEEGLRSNHPLAGIAILLISLAWIGLLFANYDAQNRSVAIPATTAKLQLRIEKDSPERGPNEHSEQEHDRDDDD